MLYIYIYRYPFRYTFSRQFNTRTLEIMLIVRAPSEDTMGVIGLIMLFVRPIKIHGGRYRVKEL